MRTEILLHYVSSISEINLKIYRISSLLKVHPNLRMQDDILGKAWYGNLADSPANFWFRVYGGNINFQTLLVDALIMLPVSGTFLFLPRSYDKKARIYVRIFNSAPETFHALKFWMFASKTWDVWCIGEQFVGNFVLYVTNLYFLWLSTNNFFIRDIFFVCCGICEQLWIQISQICIRYVNEKWEIQIKM